MKLTFRSGIFWAILMGLAVAGQGWAKSPMIGKVEANGSFRINNATYSGNATVFEGVTLETAGAVSTLDLSTGTRMILGADSRGKVFGDHLVLERGQGRLENASNFHLEARGLTIQPETGNSTARVLLTGNEKVQVAALTGSFRILNANGLLVAKLARGMALSFEPRGGPTLTHVTGQLSLRAGHYLLTDETTHVTLEIAGKNLDRNAGRRVEITGTMDAAVTPASEASQLVRASSTLVLAQNGTPSNGGSGSGTGTGSGGSSGAGTDAGGTAAAGTAAGGSASLGLGIAAIAIIGGVAAAATVGGLAAAGTFNGGSGTISR